jgi:GNAT superfamily N-acetyltransferase
MYMTFTVSRPHGILLADPDDETRYILNIDGRLHHDDSIVGHLHATKIVLSGATNQQQSWFDVCDYSQSTYDVYAAMCDGDDYRDFFDGGGGADLLYLETAEVVRQFRGHGLGRVMVLETLNMFESGCGAVVLEPHPVRQKDDGSVSKEDSGAQGWREAMDWTKLARTEAQYEQGAKKLQHYWQKLGFKAVPKSKRFWYRDCALMPSVDEEALRKPLRALQER